MLRMRKKGVGRQVSIVKNAVVYKLKLQTNFE